MVPNAAVSSAQSLVGVRRPSRWARDETEQHHVTVRASISRTYVQGRRKRPQESARNNNKRIRKGRETAGGTD